MQFGDLIDSILTESKGKLQSWDEHDAVEARRHIANR
jgi:hypothetical protein